MNRFALDAATPGLVGLAAAILWISGLAPGVTWLDAGELGAAAWELGIAHPPGFPAGLLLQKTVMLLVPVGDVGFRGNLASAIVGGAALAFAAAAARRWGLGALATVAALLPVALAPAFARHAVTIEVYTGVGLFVAVALWLVSRPAGVPLEGRRAMALALLFGLAFGHHAELWLLLGPFAGAAVIATALRRTDRRWAVVLGGATLAVIVGASVLAYLPLRAAADPWRDWGHPATLSALLDHLSGARIRAAYGDEMGLPAADALLQFGTDVVRPLGPAFALGLPGLVLLGRRPGGGWVTGLLVVDLLYATTINPMGLRDQQNGLITPLLCALGLAAALDWAVSRAPGRVLPFTRLAAALAVFGLGWGAVPFDRRGDRGAPAWTDYALASVPPTGVAFVASDTLAAGAAFAQVVEGARPDVAVLVRQHLWDASSVEPVRRRLPEAFGAWRVGDPPSALPPLADPARRPGVRWEWAGGLDAGWAPPELVPGLPLFGPAPSGPADSAVAGLASASRFVDALEADDGLAEPQARRTLSLWAEDLSLAAGVGAEVSANAYALALALRPDAAAAIHGRRAAAYAARGDAATALALARRALAAAPDAPLHRRAVARYALNAGDVETALAYADTAVALLPDDAEALGLRGMARARLGRFDEAAEDFRSALALDPKQPEAVVGMKRLGEMGKIPEE